MRTMEAAIQDMARMLDPLILDLGVFEVEIELVPDELNDPWFTDDDAIFEVTEDAYQLDRSMRMHAALAIA
ncbi:MAG TPA: hypothetical protein VM513_11225 [Kofleriaceae bacterium]|nr:hypothetical protein [Kofleriaceae bacterium]